MLGVDDLGRALRGLLGDELVVPDVAPLDPAGLVLGAAHHDAGVDVGGALEGGVDVVLEGDQLAPAPRPVAGDHRGHAAVEHPVADRVGGEAPEDDRVGRADAGARQHGHDDLRDHAHVDRDAVALAHAPGPQAVGQAADPLVQVRVGDRDAVAGLALPVERDPVAALGEVPVQAVDGGVERPVREPGEEGRVGAVARDGRLARPVEHLLRLLEPEGLGIRGGAVEEVRRRDGVPREVGGRGEAPILHLEGFDRRAVGAHSLGSLGEGARREGYAEMVSVGTNSIMPGLAPGESGRGVGYIPAHGTGRGREHPVAGTPVLEGSDELLRALDPPRPRAGHHRHRRGRGSGPVDPRSRSSWSPA